MDILKGIRYNFRGLMMGLRTPRLLILGLLRFLVVLLIGVGAAVIFLAYHQDIMQVIWSKPESLWILWLWYIASWLLSLTLLAMTSVLGYFVCQILFCVLIMDQMSRITERLVTGQEKAASKLSLPAQLIYLIKQETPRAIIPVLVTLGLMAIGWLTPLGPVFTVVGPLAAAMFLAWDNTDLLPARRLDPFQDRFQSFRRQLMFHLGFGLPFLIPLANLLLLSFAPIGATLYQIEKDPPHSSAVGPID
ncbi:MAG: EI24 domain-containing protein [Desulfobacterales bacterium]|jgi:CysZ protein